MSLTREEVSHCCADHSIRWVEPIVFQFALFVILPVARECIDPFRFRFEKFGKVLWRIYLDIIS